MRRRRLTLQEKVFVVKSYYANHEISNMVQEQFNTEYKVQTTKALLKTINKIVSRFEKTGSVVEDIYLDSGTLLKERAEEEKEDVKVSTAVKKEPIKVEDDQESIQDYPVISVEAIIKEEEEVVLSEETSGNEGELDFDLDSLGAVSEAEDDPVELQPKRTRPKKDNDPSYEEEVDSIYTCPICGKAFTSRKNRNNHKETHKPVEKWKYFCSICERPCRTNLLRRQHELCHLGKLERDSLNCNICGNTYTTPDGLRKHYQSHSQKYNSVCDICGKVSKSLKQLKTHLRVHTGEKPFECKVCHKRYAHKNSYLVHYRTHTGDKPFKCKTCGKAFGDKSTLRVHHRQHTGENPYVCQFCGKTCKQAQNLRSHIRHIHKPATV